MTEVDLIEGWLRRDIARAQKRLGEWADRKTVDARLWKRIEEENQRLREDLDLALDASMRDNAEANRLREANARLMDQIARLQAELTAKAFTGQFMHSSVQGMKR